MDDTIVLIVRLFTIIDYSTYYSRYLSTLKISDNTMIFFYNSERLNLIILIMKVIDR